MDVPMLFPAVAQGLLWLAVILVGTWVLSGILSDEED